MHPAPISESAENAFILLVSYFFYGWWDWRFLTLLFASLLLDFLVGYHLEKTNNPADRKMLLAASLVGNLGLLGFFKYYNFRRIVCADAGAVWSRRKPQYITDYSAGWDQFLHVSNTEWSVK